ncbi:MAG: tRNA uridine(34) 5-carboxymethylaminomethyl modification radical SAM/GNAT enzyme Elp3 [Patescibacteria group bacterium]
MTDKLITAVQRIAQEEAETEAEVRKIKRSVAKTFGGPVPSNAELLATYLGLLGEGKMEANTKLEHLFRTSQVRSLSGVAVITVLTKPYGCPGRCVYCPTEARMPKSYLANEPAAARALGQDFDPYKQVKVRLEALRVNGHVTDKCELIVLGGTWTAYPKDYQEWFLQRCYDAFNQMDSTSLDEAKTKNETADHRVIGLTLETRPDHVTQEEVVHMRWLGTTRVQLGIQSTNSEVLKLNKRNETREQQIAATRLLKEAGFKITHHLMQGLPGATVESDVQTAWDVFQAPDYQPDHVKIYPCVVIKTAELYTWWKEGKYKPYTTEQLQQLLIEVKKLIPPYVRIERLIRDIPAESILAGNMTTNLRQLLKEKGVECQCLRCREPRARTVTADQVVLVTREYEASGGRELFLSFESPDKSICYAFCRLRLQDAKEHWMPVLKDAAIVRELHTYGKLVPMGGEHNGAAQHQGFGKRLMAEAERIAQQAGYKKIAVIAGVGVREYFKKNGYNLEDEYMVKRLGKIDPKLD